MSTLRVEIVTPVFNRRELTLRWLRSIRRLNSDGLDIHVVIVDDGSTDGTADAVREQFPEVEIVQGTGDLWYTAGTNRAIEAALKHDPDFVLACNNDSIFEQDCVKIMVECALRHERSVVGAVLLNWETPHKIFQVAPQWQFWAGGMRHWHQQTVWTLPKRAFEVGLIVGNCVLYPTAAIKEAGLMDEKRLIQYGDAEYTPRMKRLGWKLLIEPKARVFCLPNDPPPGLGTMSLRQKLRALFVNSGNANSLHRRVYTTMFPAPNKLLGLLAVPIFYVRWAIGKNLEGSYGQRVPEPKLSETYADALADAD